MNRRLRLGMLVTHPIQYFVPLYRLLAARDDVELTVLFHTHMGVDAYRDAGFGQDVRWDISLLDGYPHRFLSVRKTLGGIQWRIVPALLRRRFDVLVLHGYNTPTNVLAMAAARVVGTRVLMRGDTRAGTQAQGLGRAWLKRHLLAFCDGAIAIGSANRDYWLAQGVASARVFFAPFSVDNARFHADAAQRQVFRKRLRASLGLDPQAELILFAAKLIARKRAADLIAAFARVTARFPQAQLLIVGSGMEEGALRAQAAQAVAGRVHFLGFRNQAELPRLYAGCDVFVLPAAAEPWGLAVNEAMAAGLAVIVSDEVGAAPDLVQDRGTGCVYHCGDVGALAVALERLLADQPLRARMGERAQAVIAEWDIARTADALAGSALRVLEATEHRTRHARGDE